MRTVFYWIMLTRKSCSYVTLAHDVLTEWMSKRLKRTNDWFAPLLLRKCCMIGLCHCSYEKNEWLVCTIAPNDWFGELAWFSYYMVYGKQQPRSSTAAVQHRLNVCVGVDVENWNDVGNKNAFWNWSAIWKHGHVGPFESLNKTQQICFRLLGWHLGYDTSMFCFTSHGCAASPLHRDIMTCAAYLVSTQKMKTNALSLATVEGLYRADPPPGHFPGPNPTHPWAIKT